jgi:hypothetical protein
MRLNAIWTGSWLIIWRSLDLNKTFGADGLQKGEIEKSGRR